MKLIELKPEIINKAENRPFVEFDCPLCQKHRIEVPIFPTPNAWGKIGDSFETITLSPSIAHKNYDADFDGKGRLCDSHFFIRNGEIQLV